MYPMGIRMAGEYCIRFICVITMSTPYFKMTLQRTTPGTILRSSTMPRSFLGSSRSTASTPRWAPFRTPYAPPRKDTQTSR